MRLKKLSIVISVFIITGLVLVVYSKNVNISKKQIKMTFSYPDLTIEEIADISDVVAKISVANIDVIPAKDKDKFSNEKIKSFSEEKNKNTVYNTGDTPPTVDVITSDKFIATIVEATISDAYKDAIGLDKNINIYIPSDLIEGYREDYIQKGKEYVVLLNGTQSGLLKLVSFHFGMLACENTEKFSLISDNVLESYDLINRIESYYK